MTYLIQFLFQKTKITIRTLAVGEAVGKRKEIQLVSEMHAAVS